MDQQLDYADMLEIPVNTVNVVKKKGFFPKRKEKKSDEELKDLVLDSVNERVGSFVEAEDITDPPKTKEPVLSFGDKSSKILFGEMVAAVALAIGIFLTNVFIPDTIINTYIANLTDPPQTVSEKSYSEIELTSVVSEASDATVSVSGGVLSVEGSGSIYPVCDGEIASISENNGLFTVEIAHTSTFSSVFTNLTNVYYAVGTKVEENLPFAYSNGENTVSVSLFDGQTMLNNFSLTNEIPVWNI